MNDLEAIQKRFESEVMTAAVAFYTWKSINNVASKDQAVYTVMNKDALTWNAITHSLQTTALITLGRIFDVDSGALSVHTYLRKCLSEIDQFSPAHLRRRKIALAKGGPTPWLDEYMANAENPSPTDFRNLKLAAKRYHQKYEAVYKPIRNQVLAHKELATIGNVDVLFAKTRIGDIENTLEFLHQLSQVVFQFLYNGRRTELSDYHLNKEAEVLQSVGSLFARMK